MTWKKWVGFIVFFVIVFPFVRQTQENRRYGYIDTTGKWVVPPKFYGGMRFSDGLAPVKVSVADFNKVNEQDKWGYVDKQGALVIPAKFSMARPFSEGCAGVSENGKVGFIDKQGRYIVKPQFDSKPSDFHEGLAVVQVGFRKGYVNKQGKLIIKAQFEEANDFSEGLANVRQPECRVTGYIDTQGKIALPPQYYTAGRFSNGLAYVQANDPQGGYIDKTGKMLFQVGWRAEFKEGLAEAIPPGSLFNRKKGFIDPTGKMVIKPQYYLTGSFSDGLAWVYPEEILQVYGYINRTGDFQIKPQFWWSGGPHDFHEGLAAVQLGPLNGVLDLDALGFIDQTGKVVIPARFHVYGSREDKGDFHEGLACVMN